MPDTDPALYLRLFPRIPAATDHAWAWAVHDGRGPALVGSVGSSAPAGRLMDRLRGLERPLGTWQVLAAIDSFRMARGKEAPLPSFAARPLLDALLAPSGGVILWHHQLEAVLSMAGFSEAVCERLRKGWNARDAEAIARCDRSALSGQPVSAVITERLVYGGTVRARPEVASRVMELLWGGRV